MDAERLIFSFFKAKGYKSSENALKAELKTVFKADPGLSICFPAMNELLKSIHDLNQDDSYFHAFGLLKSWVDSSPDFYQHDLKKVMGPLFVHTYLKMVRRDMQDSATQFFEEYSNSHWDQRDLEKLVKIRSPEDPLGDFSNKCKVSIQKYSFNQLIHFLESQNLVIILSILNQNIEIDLSPSQSQAVLLGEELSIQNSKTQVTLYEERGKKEPKVPLPYIADILEQRSSETNLRIINKPETLPSVICHTIRNANEALCIDMSEDSLMMAAGFDDSVIRVFYVSKSKIPEELIGHSGAVYSVSIAPRSDFLVSGSEDATIRLWSLDSHSCLVAYRFHNLPVWNVKFSPFGYYFSSGSHDKTAAIWAMDSIKPLRMLAGHTSDVLYTVFNYKATYIATCSADKTVRLWDVATGECCRIFNSHCHPVNTCVFTRDNKFLCTGDEYGDVIMWDINKKCSLWTVQLVSGISSISICYDDALLLVGCDNKEVYTLNQPGKVLAAFKSKVEILYTGFSYRNLGVVCGITRINGYNT
ncbi:hypothetical protein SteCoe_5359 [Stentor coeruleus]|uniref:TFIID subunit TAF5 NTD2 domain-containing protein n=1 Tax=Stentor coeruleus TaxID=5963 RepID=A0A1R2CSH5_9CILI|nr:hypothetical protein SteCoe_5359 [Stentor coeruleus]